MAEEPTTEIVEAPTLLPDVLEVVEAYIRDTRGKVAAGGDKRPNLSQRLLAMSLELGKLVPDGEREVSQGSNKKFKYHTIQQVTRNVNALQALYHVRVFAQGAEVLESPDRNVRVKVHFRAECYETAEMVEWSWVDDGSILTHAGSYAVKYGLMKHFNMSDGQDPDLLDLDAKSENAKGAPRSRTQATRGTEQGARPAAATSAPESEPDPQIAALFDLIKEDVLPKKYLWNNGKVIAMMQAHDVKQKQNKLSDDEKQYTPAGWLFQKISEDHLKDHGKDGTCEHIEAAKEVFSAASS